MNMFNRQGKALPSEVRTQVIEKLLGSEGTANISRQSNLPTGVGSSELVVARYCSELQFSSSV